jgi:hypothetical protein
MRRAFDLLNQAQLAGTDSTAIPGLASADGLEGSAAGQSKTK